MYQLLLASNLGMACPHTVVTNTVPDGIHPTRRYVIKPLDTTVLRVGKKEAFVYANVVQGSELIAADFGLAPTVIQEFIGPKVDARVTVVGTDVFAVEIRLRNAIIEGDWRKEKENVQYISIHVARIIVLQMYTDAGSSQSIFWRIRLRCEGWNLYFLEVNPTGEWAWLPDSAGQNIHYSICNLLQSGRHEAN